MPFRPIDPAKRGSSLGKPAGATDMTSAPLPTGDERHAVLKPIRASPDGIVVRERVRSPAAAPASDTAKAPDRTASVSKKRAHHVVDRSGPNWPDGDYLVGKYRPPKATQWKKGQSGNPRGPKPQEKLSPEAAFEKEILAEFTAKVNGEEVKLNMGSFVVQLLKAGAAKGTVKSQQMLLELFLATVRKSVSREDTAAVEVWEQQLIDSMLQEYGLPDQPVFRKRDRTIDEEDGEC